jgi:uncharacterized Zn finger protein
MNDDPPIERDDAATGPGDPGPLDLPGLTGLPGLPRRSSRMPQMPRSAVAAQFVAGAGDGLPAPEKSPRRLRVLAIDLAPGRVGVTLRTERRDTCEVEVRVVPLAAEAARRFVELLRGNNLHVARLLAGELTSDLLVAAQAIDVTLLPRLGIDLTVACDCGLADDRCSHRSAVIELLGDEITRDPFVLLQLRGIDRSTLLARLGGDDEPQAHDATVEDELREPLPTDPATFWAAPHPEPLHLGELDEPEVPAVLVRRLGEFPFWRGSRSLLPVLERVYRKASRAALELLRG